MRTLSSNRRHGQRGQALMEFGLAFMVFLMVMYGIMEFGRMMASYNILAGAAREGARYATVHGTASGSTASSTDVQTVVRNWSLGLDANSVLVTTTWSPGKGPGSKVKVAASYAMVPFSGLILKNNMTLTSSSTMVISQ
jgi:Flp pilus assembly protein TadG